MDRRTLLARLGAAGAVGLAGCGGPPTATSGPADERTSTAPATPRAQRRVDVESVADVADEHALRLDVQILESRVTDAHTARIRLVLTNEGPPREIPVSTGRCALLNRYSQASAPRGVWLAPTGGQYVTERGPRWTAAPPENGAYPDYGCAGRRFSSGEAVATEYGVFDDARAGGYLDSGRYRFERRLSAEPLGGGDGAIVEWGFVLVVEEPGCRLFC